MPKYNSHSSHRPDRCVRIRTICERFTASPSRRIAKKLAGITAFGNATIAAIDQLATAEIITPEIVAEAESLAASLEDPAKVYQAKRGDDAAALAAFKARAAQKVADLKERL
ncbi:hypothetical protein [Leptolyngbya sp. 7M]|uniref:hypothetical protein n=1 Tax=Leptolyngbya sp. 7M TaxID=2812896 RepID=UPI001B8C07D7|nr:hypothetical protein [Leptolyngbya sp. 7M]QYO63152.1 hypothetical protein JVX88_24800 [Leptolyngbya sp. 7M]